MIHDLEQEGIERYAQQARENAETIFRAMEVSEANLPRAMELYEILLRGLGDRPRPPAGDIQALHDHYAAEQQHLLQLAMAVIVSACK